MGKGGGVQGAGAAAVPSPDLLSAGAIPDPLSTHGSSWLGPKPLLGVGLMQTWGWGLVGRTSLDAGTSPSFHHASVPHCP